MDNINEVRDDELSIIIEKINNIYNFFETELFIDRNEINISLESPNKILETYKTSITASSFSQISNHSNQISSYWNFLNKFDSIDNEELKNHINTLSSLLGKIMIINSDTLSEWRSFTLSIQSHVDKIEQKYKNFNLKEYIKSDISELVNPNQKIKESYFLILKEKLGDQRNNHFLYNFLLQRAFHHLALKNKELLESSDDGIIKLKSLKKINPGLALHVQKTALNQASLNIFQKEDDRYDELYFMDIITDKHYLNSVLDEPLNDNQIAYAYVSVKSMAKPIIPRNADIINRINGKNYTPVDVFHFDKNYLIPCDILEKEYQVEVNLKIGIILAQKTSDVNKNITNVVDVDKLLSDAMSKNNKNYTNKETSHNRTVENYINIADKLVNANATEWKNIVNKK